jgi:drug/metabolite transporter (DMT)-like permease
MGEEHLDSFHLGTYRLGVRTGPYDTTPLTEELLVDTRAAGGTGLGLALLSAASFGTSGTFAASLLAAGWTPGAAVTVRVVLAALVLTVPAVLLLRGRLAALRRGARTVTGYGLAAVAGCQLCYFNAVQHLSVAVALLVEYSGALLASIFRDLARISGRSISGWSVSRVVA